MAGSAPSVLAMIGRPGSVVGVRHLRRRYVRAASGATSVMRVVRFVRQPQRVRTGLGQPVPASASSSISERLYVFQRWLHRDLPDSVAPSCWAPTPRSVSGCTRQPIPGLVRRRLASNTTLWDRLPGLIHENGVPRAAELDRRKNLRVYRGDQLARPAIDITLQAIRADHQHVAGLPLQLERRSDRCEVLISAKPTAQKPRHRPGLFCSPQGAALPIRPAIAATATAAFSDRYARRNRHSISDQSGSVIACPRASR